MTDTRLKAKLDLHANFWTQFNRPPKDEAWQWVLRRSGLSTHRLGKQHTHYRLRALYVADAPRYEPPGATWAHPLCEVTMLRGPRAGQPCGKGASLSFKVTDPGTGEWRIQGWCSKHRTEADPVRRLQAQRVAAGLPEPHPNVGGLLPCYIRATNWPEIYESASVQWKPPTAGICADDWHTPASAAAVAAVAAEHDAVQSRRTFTAVAGGGERTATEPPALRLVP